ncbi:acetate permease, partial [Bifidobacterium longum]
MNRNTEKPTNQNAEKPKYRKTGIPKNRNTEKPEYR